MVQFYTRRVDPPQRKSTVHRTFCPKFERATYQAERIWLSGLWIPHQMVALMAVFSGVKGWGEGGQNDFLSGHSPLKREANAVWSYRVWIESSLCAQWVAKDPSFLRADSEESDQTGPGWSESSLSAHAILLVLSWGGLNLHCFPSKKRFSLNGKNLLHFYKGANFCNFLLSILHSEALLKTGLVSQERICSFLLEMFPFQKGIENKKEVTKVISLE